MIPKAMRMTIYIGGAAAVWVCLAFVLSIPDIGAVVGRQGHGPHRHLARAAMGDIGFRGVIVVVLISFVSCLLSLQAAASRLIFAYARDQMIFGSRFLSRMSPGHHVPANALIVMRAIPAVIALSSLWLANAIDTIISFAAVGIYIAFQMIVLAALMARVKGWRPAGAFTLGAWGCPGQRAGTRIWRGRDREHSLAAAAERRGPLVCGLRHGGDHRRRHTDRRRIHGSRQPYARGNAPAGDAHLLAARKRPALDSAAH